MECAGSAALEVTSEALKTLESGTAQESNAAAAQHAARAFEDLARHTEVTHLAIQILL